MKLDYGLFKCVNCGQENRLGDCCQDCAGFDCVVCDKQIALDEDIEITEDRKDLNLQKEDKICNECFESLLQSDKNRGIKQ